MRQVSAGQILCRLVLFYDRCCPKPPSCSMEKLSLKRHRVSSEGISLMSNSQSAHWFALKVFYNRVFEVEGLLGNERIETYIPCEHTVMERDGKKINIRKPLIASLAFFHSTVPLAASIQRMLSDKAMLYTHIKDGRKMPAAIPESEMNVFMLVTSSGEQGLEYLGDDDAKFHTGERVQVIDGPFKGAEGHICRIKKDRRLIVSIQGVCAVATSYIPQCFLRKI